MSSRGIAVLGSTGTIGSNTLDLIRAFPDRFKAVSLAAGQNIEKLKTQIREFNPEIVSVLNAADARVLEQEFPWLKVTWGDAGVLHCINSSRVDVVVVGIVGFAGLRPTLEAIRSHKVVALANKESLVTAGSLLRHEIQKAKGYSVPVDSEHNALFQLLRDQKREDIASLVLTASGGPFWNRPELPLEDITPEQAIRHPNWKMGPKISVDSATLMNKGLELIEAHFLFEVPENQIEVWVHPQSVVHGAVWFKDNSCVAQLSVPDMKSSIGYALGFPERLEAPVRKLSFSDMTKLEFFEPDTKRFPALLLAREALRAGQSHIIGLNASNEIAVQAFLEGKILFPSIPRFVETYLQQHRSIAIQSLEDVFATDSECRKYAMELLSSSRFSR